MSTVEERLQAIEKRNKSVATEKAWEVSFTRRASIAILTYITVSLFLWMVNVPYPLMNALVPMCGYFLSTLSLPWIKKLWTKRHESNT